MNSRGPGPRCGVAAARFAVRRRPRRAWLSSRSSRRSPAPRGSAGRGRPANCGTRSCPSGCAHDVRLEDIIDLVGHSSTSVTETVYRHEIRPALTDNATAVNRTPEGERHRAGLPLLRESHWLPNWLPKIKSKNLFYQSGRRDLNPRPLDPQASLQAKLPAKIYRLPALAGACQFADVRGCSW